METLSKHFESVYQKAKNYTETSIELYKLNAIDTTADIASALVLKFALVLVISIFTMFLNIAISLFIGNRIGNYYLGFLIVSIFYLIIALLIYLFNDVLIKTPITNLVISKLSKRRKTQNKAYNPEDNESLQK
ncbi:hypothetical protein [Flavivirga sp. 57AJ16]|uniref:hypothetical protein n=1 Tax=Flavivirga sp. 57AJ16 TaxID=3025307 RepID=UPI0023664AD7|nr:hypothetical protein [Flavivirga sp. 57AJ16]MDD7886616.1 hypothetical protein [Flavivirga sp. 57AJ16]